MSKARLTHLDEHGAAHMVDVGAKAVTRRRATAEGRIRMSAVALEAIREGTKKGDALQVARIAGIQGAKKTSDLIPLCHPLSIDKVSVNLHIEDETCSVVVRATVECTGRTGVEMEALTSATTALLTVYDMAKAVERTMQIDGIRLVAKSGGRSGDYRAEE
jgi:cyclic pyranopterin phosphate synthase